MKLIEAIAIKEELFTAIDNGDSSLAKEGVVMLIGLILLLSKQNNSTSSLDETLH